MSREDVEKLKRDYEDAAVVRLREALPTVHVKEIRRLVKEFDGDATKVFEVLEGLTNTELKEPTTPENEPPPLPNENPQPPDSPPDPQQDGLSRSMEILSLNPGPPPPLDQTEDDEHLSLQMEREDPKEKARQRRNMNTARKQRLAKKEEKEAAKRRKHMQTLALEKTDDDTKSTSARELALKAIVI